MGKIIELKNPKLTHKCLDSAKMLGEVLQYSISPEGTPLITFDTEYPRFIHAEVMTHRVFSRNAASSRAIPISKSIEQVKNNMAHPIHWGANQSGMQADNELDDHHRVLVEQDWQRAAEYMCYIAARFQEHGAHKQFSNRVLETFTHIKTIITTTEIPNFEELRTHKDAQPEFQVLAKAMMANLKAATPMQLKEGEAHVPYVDRVRGEDGVLRYFVNNVELTLEEALKVSASACAQVSYRVLNLGLDKALVIYDRLVGSRPVHASPFEHQAFPIMEPQITKGNFATILAKLPKGVTHIDKKGFLWSGNFKGWIQNRQILGEF